MEAIADNADQYEELSQRQILYLMWDIHRDARRFFSKVAPLDSTDDLLPRSSLAVVTRMVQGGNIMTSSVGVPETEFLGLSVIKSLLTSPGGGTPSELFPDAAGSYKGPYTNSQLPPEFAQALAPLLKTHPNINTFVLCRQLDDVRLSDISVGKRGHHCSNYGIVGRCGDKKCRYAHSPTNPSPEKVQKIVGHLKRVVAQVQNHGLKSE